MYAALRLWHCLSLCVYEYKYKNLVSPDILAANQSMAIGVAITKFLTDISKSPLHLSQSLPIPVVPLGSHKGLLVFYLLVAILVKFK